MSRRHFATASGVTHKVSYSHGSVPVAGTEHTSPYPWVHGTFCDWSMLFSAWCSCRHFRYHGTEDGRRAAVKEHIKLANLLVPRMTERQWQLLGAFDAESRVRAWNAALAVSHARRLARWDWQDVTPVYVIGRGLRWTVSTLVPDCHGPCCPVPVPIEVRRHAEFVWGLVSGGWSRRDVMVGYLQPSEMEIAPEPHDSRDSLSASPLPPDG